MATSRLWRERDLINIFSTLFSLGFDSKRIIETNPSLTYDWNFERALKLRAFGTNGKNPSITKAFGRQKVENDILVNKLLNYFSTKNIGIETELESLSIKARFAENLPLFNL